MLCRPKIIGNPLAAPSAAVVAWRTERLIAAGLPFARASSVATDCRYDLHALLSLIDQGCPAETAVRIVAPLRETSRPC
jgi:hypothetical protein